MNASESFDTFLYIGDRWRSARNGRTRAVIDPASGETIGRVAHADEVDLEDAANAAHSGFVIWRDTPAIVRSRLIRRASDLIRERANDIGLKVTREQGKPLLEAIAEAVAAAELLEWFADEGLRVYGRIVPPRDGLDLRQFVLKEPIGPVVAFTPWNFPLTQIARKIGPALATGCSIILKAPEETPAGPAALVQAFLDAGLPSGVLNLVFGDPAQIANHLIAHSNVRKVTFTGSTAIGKLLAQTAGSYMKRVTMELGGHAPVVVANDADVDNAVAAMAQAKFRNAGQVCIAPSRFLVHEDLKLEFGQKMAQIANELVVGSGLDERTKMGPLANPRRLGAMQRLTSNALNCGAHLLAGGEQIGTKGNFWQPTVLSDVPSNALIFNEEPFGPIVAIQGFSSIYSAINEANRLPYGLAGYAFTRSMKTTGELMRRMHVGMLWINTAARAPAELPFGGLRESGYGSEGGHEALLEYLYTRAVTVKEA